MQRHILPVAAEIDRDVDSFQQRHKIAIVPPCVPRRMFHDDSQPEIVPGMRGVMEFEKVLIMVIAASPL